MNDVYFDQKIRASFLSTVIERLAENKEACEEIARILEIEGGGENAGEYVQAAFQEVALENYKKLQAARKKRFEERIGVTAQQQEGRDRD